MAIDIDAARRLTRAAVIGRDGKKLGTVAAVYYDNDTDEPDGSASGLEPVQQAVESVKSTAQHAKDIGADKGGSADTGRRELRPGPAGTVQSNAGSNS